MDILYLDLDGVLHHEDVWRTRGRGVHFGSAGAGHTLFEHADLLCRILTPYPSLQIVLSTSWVRVLRYSYAVKRLPVGLRERVVGATYHSRHMDEAAFEALTRAQQILGDVGRRKPDRWLALDDDGEGWPEEHRPRLVLTDPALGISHALTLVELQSKLANVFTG